MDVSKSIELSRLNEVKILQNVRVIQRNDLNHIHSKENLRVQFQLDGQVRGYITCYMCIDEKDLSPSEKNFLFPLFVESMNILVGKQLSLDPKLNALQIKLSTPKFSMVPKVINTSFKSSTQKYKLEIDDINYDILYEYSLENLN